ncbi:MAG: rhomboid family intramembrane serine protease [Candidatus Eisenbacteria bacterium]
MFPIRDDVPSRTFPIITVGLIAVNVLVFLFEVSLGSKGLRAFVGNYGMVPGHVTAFARGGDVSAGQAFFPFFSSMFLHGGWIHLIGNMWYLWIFGDNIEDRLGHIRFLVFYIVCGLVANGGHYALNATSGMPAIGASGAVAGVLGAYLVSYPRARILTVVPLFFLLHFIELPALIVLGFWFILQVFSGAASVVSSSATGGVAWWAHVGGFIGGILVFMLFRPKPRVLYRSR